MPLRIRCNTFWYLGIEKNRLLVNIATTKYRRLKLLIFAFFWLESLTLEGVQEIRMLLKIFPVCSSCHEHSIFFVYLIKAILFSAGSVKFASLLFFRIDLLLLERSAVRRCKQIVGWAANKLSLLIRKWFVSYYVCVVFFVVWIRVLNRSCVRVIETDFLLFILSNYCWLNCVFCKPIIEVEDIRVLVGCSCHLSGLRTLHENVIVGVIVLDWSLIECFTLVGCGDLGASWRGRRLDFVGKQALSLLLLLDESCLWHNLQIILWGTIAALRLSIQC